MNKITKENLRRALAAESEAQVRYEEFARRADEEGFGNVARVFRATSYAEKIHAARDLRTLAGVKSTLDNLTEALDDASFDAQQMYPSHAAVARLQGDEDAAIEMEWALETEKQQVNMYQDAKSAIEAGRDVELMAVFVCPVCGYTAKDQPPNNCPLSGTPGREFRGF